MVPEWTSIYPGVFKFPPGSWLRYHLEVEDGRPGGYWELPPVGETEGKTEEEWVDEIEALLWDATESTPYRRTLGCLPLAGLTLRWWRQRQEGKQPDLPYHRIRR